MNPLDAVGQRFSLSLANPNPKAARLKDGARYRIEFEVDKDTWDDFMGARELAGLVIECEAEVTGLNTPAPAKNSAAVAYAPNEPSTSTEGSGPPTAGPLKGGKLAQDAAIICATAEFQHFVELQGVEPVGEESAAEYVRVFCNVESRAELDHNPKAAERFASLMRSYRAWRKKA